MQQFLFFFKVFLLGLMFSNTKAEVINIAEISSTDLTQAVKAAVYIQAHHGNGVGGSGSGVVIDSSGQVITNYHVIEHNGKIAKTLRIGLVKDIKSTVSPTYTASVLSLDKKNDLAILQIDKPLYGKNAQKNTSFNAIKLMTTPLQLNDEVNAIGFPGIGNLDNGASLTVTQGRVAGFIDDRWIKIDIRIAPGNSGGMLINDRGELVGINTMVKSAEKMAVGLGYARPVSMIHSLVAKLKSNSYKPNNRSPNKQGQRFAYRNRIIDSETGQAIKQVEVTLLNPDVMAYEFQAIANKSDVFDRAHSDSQGKFEIKGLVQAQKYSWVIQHQNYITLEQDNMNLKMMNAPIKLQRK